jgi:HSP20 family molecular chaperone IbpA
MTEKSTAVQMAPETATLKVVEPKTLFERINRLHDAIARRAFAMFENDGGFLGHGLEHWLKAEAELLHPVHIKLTETGEAVELQAEVPGFDSKDLEISLESGRVVISGKKESSAEHKKEKVLYSEQCSDAILRVIELPTEVDATKASATLKNGVLVLNIPKAAHAKATKVEVKAAR